MVLKILIQYNMSWYTFDICSVYSFLTFNVVYKLVYDRYILGLQRMTRKMVVTDNV